MQFLSLIGIIKIMTLVRGYMADLIYIVNSCHNQLPAPHNLNAGSVVRATKRLKCIERGDSVVELDNFKSTLQGYKAPLQEVRDSL